MSSLLEVDQHFAFGENWQSYAQLIDSKRIAQAEDGMRHLFPNGELQGKSFLDIGCGSGLHSLAAIRMGAVEIDATDLDPNSIAAATFTLSNNAPGGNWKARVKSVFDLDPREGQYDVVYSWGVLHHTGDMWRAVDKAAAMVKPGGRFAVALYRKTPVCGFWALEKKFYTRSPRPVQALLRAIYEGAMFAKLLLTLRSPFRYLRDFNTRGMNFSHDVHDWLGGYPYESAAPQRVRDFLKARGFRVERDFITAPGSGIWGSGCDEFVAVRESKSAA